MNVHGDTPANGRMTGYTGPGQAGWVASEVMTFATRALLCWAWPPGLARLALFLVLRSLLRRWRP